MGRVDLFHHRTLSYGGTGWLVDENIAVTNRHVARIFAEADWNGELKFRAGVFGETMEARLNYVRERDAVGDANRRAAVTKVLFIAQDGQPDIAFLEVQPNPNATPVELFTGKVKSETPVAAIGYPAKDPLRNDPQLMDDLFGGKYDVKRFSPGLVTGTQRDDVIVLGDYTMLGGNSGSPIIDLATGKAVGLHFAGVFKESNYSVASDIVAAALASMKTVVAVDLELIPTEATPASAFAGRDGYNPDFLGKGQRTVPWPGLGDWKSDVAPVSDDDNNILKYRHFAVIQSKSRRLPLVTAVNIDGAKSFRLKRKGSWKTDGRLDPKHQIDNVLYRHNPLDRGHMVRRRDPGWGAKKSEAQQAEIDTFHYTNSTPQHKDLNQKAWVGLEDYILESAETKDFKVTVLTGPVFREDDRRLKDQPGVEGVQIPEEFWKVAVMVNTKTKKLSAAGYVLSHGRMIRDLIEAPFILGEYKTYQVQIAKIEAETGLDFGRLRQCDPLGAELNPEESFSQIARNIGGPADLKLSA